MPAAVEMTWRDNCSGSIMVSPVDSAPVADAQGCGYTITRTWTFTDNCGNSRDRKNVVQGKSADLGGRRIIKKKTNGQCAGDIPAAVQLTEQDNLSGSITVS